MNSLKISKIDVITIILVVLLLFVRIHFNGGLYRPAPDTNLENLAGKLDPIRNYLVEKAGFILPQPQAGLLTGIVLGVKSDLPQEFKNQLQNTSTIHIVVASGQNLTMLSGFIMALAPILGRRKTLFINLVTMLFYIVLTGLQIPIIRAGIMMTIISIAQLLGKESRSSRIVFVTAFIMLFYNPDWLLSISFQLSFLATIAVIFVSPELIKILSFTPNFIKENLAVSLSAQLLTLPIIAINFHQLSLTGIIANCLVLWTVPFIMISGAIVILITVVFPVFGMLLNLVPAALLTYFVYIISFLGTVVDKLYISSLPLAFWFGYYLLLIGGYLILERYNFFKEEVKTLQTNPAI